MTLRNWTLVLAAAGMGCVGIGSAWAETPPEALQTDGSQAVTVTLPQLQLAKVQPVEAPLIVELSPVVAEASALGKPLDNSALGDLRGSGGIVVGNQTLNAITSGNNTIGNYAAGAVNISQSALSNFNGLGNITINTGAMSQLQSAMNVTVNVTP
jgi:hypothetical protein